MNSMLVILSLGIGLLPGAEAPSLPIPTHENISYGPHARNTLDFWQAKGDGPRPLLVYIHGGGWLTGDKSKKGPAFKPFLDKGISCAAFNYRLTPEHPLPAPVHDAARAIQFLRFKGRDWNINTSRIALTGPSAGACTSMWLLLHDDLANPVAVDPVLRESTRVCAASVQVGQTSIDPTVIEGWLGPNVLKHPMIFMAVGESSIDAAMRNYKIHRKVYTEFSPINHLDAKDPPLFMTCSAEMGLPCRDAGHGIHHPVYGVKLKEKSDGVGHECHLVVPGVSSSRNFDNGDVILLRKLLAAQ
jgi:acetyl esterase/lipase